MVGTKLRSYARLPFVWSFLLVTWASRHVEPSSFCGAHTRGRSSLRNSCTRDAFRPGSTDPAAALRLLGLDSASAPGIDEVKRAFKRRVVKLHPDRPGGNAKLFQTVLEAYSILIGTAPSGTSGRVAGNRAGGPSFPDEKDQAANEARFKQEENWRWDQTTGYNPSDLDDVWAEIGYNPYTGEYIPQKASNYAQSQGSTGVSPNMGDYYAAYRAQQSGGTPPKDPFRVPPRTSADGEGLAITTILQISAYILLIVLCSFRAVDLASLQSVSPPMRIECSYDARDTVFCD